MVKKNTLKGINSFFEGLNLFNNKSAKKSYNGILIIAGILGALFLMGVVFGFQEIKVNNYINGSNLTINEDSQTVFNISINDTTMNITIINITIPSSFTLNIWSIFNTTTNQIWKNANNSNVNNFTFTNTSTILIWRNNTENPLINNGTIGNILFNLTAANPGNYTIFLNATNSSLTVSTYINLSVNVNDTTAPYLVSFNSKTPVSFANLSVREIVINVSANDTFSAIGSFNISILFPNGSIANNTLLGSANFTSANLTHNETAGVNFTGPHLTDGQYIINVSNVKDYAELRGFGQNNTNATGIQRNVTIDLTVPTVTVTKSSSSTAHQIVLDVTVTDATSGIVGKQCTASGSGTGATSVSGTGGSQTATQTGLGCNTAYTYTVTCSDHSGNSGSKQVTVNTDGCSSGSSSSGTGTGGSGSDVVGSASSSFWILTYNEATTDLNGDSDGVSSLLLEGYRVKIKVDTKLYYVGVVESTDTTAKINITTTAKDKEATLNVGDVKKFDVNADDKYDVAVTLNGIDSSTGKADLSLVYIQEPVSAEDQEQVSEEVGEVPTTPTTKSKTWIWVIAILVVLAIAAAILFGKKQARHKNYGF